MLDEVRWVNPRGCEATAPYRGGIAQKSAILRGRPVAGAPYLAYRAAIPLAGWTNGTMTFL
jgi:hypothetical protein